MHIATEQALDLVEDRIDRAEDQELKQHLESCSSCAAELQTWTMLISRLRRAHLVSAPAEVVRVSKELFHSKQEPVRVGVRQIVASIIFDSFAQPALASVRAAAAAAYEPAVSRQLVLQAEEFDIYIRISMFEDHRALLGQILPRDRRGFISDASLSLRHDDDRIASAAVNDLGEFEFSDVPEGMLSLQIDLPNTTIISALHTTA